MAEQEACASAVSEALGACSAADGAGAGGDGDTRGESLLLPLLQGLLGGGGSRLLAGLGGAPADVVADVRRSLARLRSALEPPARHPQARALLQLAERLEDALDAAARRDGCRRRPRRRRAARHTVAVTHDELSQARALLDRGALDPPGGGSSATDDSRTPERQSAEGDVAPVHAVEPPVPVEPVPPQRERPPPVAHSYGYEPPANPEPQVVERRNPAPRRPDFFRHSLAEPPPPSERRPSETRSSIAAIANKFDANAQVERRPAFPRRAPVHSPQRAPREESQRSFFRPLPPTYNFAAPPTTQDDSKPLGRFGTNKKARMKRANTIDIGRFRDVGAEDEPARAAPPVPEFRPQTENDRKFVAFMKKNEADERGARADGAGGPANWSNRFGNIKNAFERGEREGPAAAAPRASSASSSARRFWRAAEEAPPPARAAEPAPARPPWAAERRERAPPARPAPPLEPALPPYRPLNYAPPPAYIPAPAQLAPAYVPAPAPAPLPSSAPAPPPAAVPQSPPRPVVVKPFAARPIPVNQFSHAPMSAFKPPAKLPSPTAAPAYVWSPPSLSAAASPSADRPPSFPPSPRPPAAGTPPGPAWPAPEQEKPRQIMNDFRNKYEPPSRRAAPDLPPPPPTHAPPPTPGHPLRAIPSQNGLAAPELVRRAAEAPRAPEPPPVDAQRLQIEFYERQIREKNALRSPPRRPEPEAKLPAPAPAPPYTVTDYTPKTNLSTFVPLQRTPDIEKARAHKVDYLPDVVTNETERPLSPRSPAALPPACRNGDVYSNGHDDGATEHEVAVTRVMRGPVRGAATITAGVRTRAPGGGAADALRGALDRVAAPRRDALQRRPARRSPPPPLARPSPPSLAASRESVASSGSAASAGGLSRSGSWHQLAAGAGAGPAESVSPRRVVARAKSMHLLAIPKMYEGGIAREEVSEKQRTVEAYFAGGGAGPARAPARRTPRAPQYALGRSRTMGALSELHFLDESNADDAFEDLVSALA